MTTGASGASIRVNGELRPLEFSVLSELVDALGHGERRSGIAVAVNGAVVVRARWATHVLQEGDVVDVVGAAQGG